MHGYDTRTAKYWWQKQRWDLSLFFYPTPIHIRIYQIYLSFILFWSFLSNTYFYLDLCMHRMRITQYGVNIVRYNMLLFDYSSGRRFSSSILLCQLRFNIFTEQNNTTQLFLFCQVASHATLKLFFCFHYFYFELFFPVTIFLHKHQWKT